MFGTLGGPELFLIFVVALIVFGPRKLPEIGKSLGKMMAEFRKASNDFRSTIETEVEAEKIRDAMKIEPSHYGGPAVEGTQASGGAPASSGGAAPSAGSGTEPAPHGGEAPQPASQVPAGASGGPEPPLAQPVEPK